MHEETFRRTPQKEVTRDTSHGLFEKLKRLEHLVGHVIMYQICVCVCFVELCACTSEQVDLAPGMTDRVPQVEVEEEEVR